MMKGEFEKKFRNAIEKGSNELFSEACQSCFETYSRLVYFLAYRETRSEEASKDVVMDTFVTLFERRGGITEIKDIKNYLCATAKHLIAKHCMSRARNVPLNEDVAGSEDNAYFDNAFYEEGLQLYGEDFELLIDRYVYGMTYKEIAIARKMNEKTVATKVKRTSEKARKDLRKYYE